MATAGGATPAFGQCANAADLDRGGLPDVVALQESTAGEHHRFFTVMLRKP